MTDHHYHAPHYRWYRMPDRAAYGLFLLAKSVWRDWWPGKTCRNCIWATTYDEDHVCCTLECGLGYGQPIDPNGCCDHWKKDI